MTAFFVAWVIGAIAFVAWRYRVEMRTTHRGAHRPGWGLRTTGSGPWRLSGESKRLTAAERSARRVHPSAAHRPGLMRAIDDAPVDLDEMDRQAHGYHHH